MKQEKSMTKFSNLIVFMLILCGLPAIFLSNNGEFDFSLDTIVSSYNEDCNRIQLSESAISSHPDHYDFLEAWDTGPGQDVKIGPDGNIYLSSGPRICIYDINGNFITEWTDDEHIEDINGIDFDSQGNLYAMESTSNQVVKLDSQGNFVLAWGIGESAVTNRIACDSQNDVYVVDYSLGRILKFDSNSNFIRSWDPPDGSSCLAIDSQDFVYVAGEYIQKYDTNGSFIKKWETPLTSDGRLNDPHGLAIDSLDALFVTEMGTPCVQKFDSDGVFITEFGSDGGQGQLNAPPGITIDSNGLVYVIDVEEDRGHIKIYTPSELHLTEPTVIYPNGGETLDGTVEIQWTPSNDSFNHSVTYSVYYSANNGNSWNLLISGLNSTSYNWDTTTLLDGINYRIKVVASCTTSFVSESISSEVFTILNGSSPPIIVFPDSGTVLMGIVTIQWQPSTNIAGLNVTYTVSYSGSNESSWITLFSNLTTTNCLWDTTTVPDGSNYLIKVEENYPGGLETTAISDGTFIIQNMPSLITTIFLPILIAIVLLGLLFWINRLVIRIEEEIMD